MTLGSSGRIRSTRERDMNQKMATNWGHAEPGDNQERRDPLQEDP
jgi:hypothetical protein